MNSYLIIAGAYLLLLNLITSYRVFRSEDYSFLQKFIQFMILWLLPFISLFVVTHFLNQTPVRLSQRLSKYKLLLSIPAFFILLKLERTSMSSSNSNYGHGALSSEELIYENGSSYGGGGD